MNSSRKTEGYSLISKNELKCVWMTAGLLTYKLCKYNLQCEKCPLDWELRNVSSTPSFYSTASSELEHRGPGEESPTPTLEGEKREEKRETEEDLPHVNIKQSLFYHSGHTWMKVESADEVRIGIDLFLAGMTGKAKVVLLSPSRRRCVRGEILCSIIQEEGILHIVSPISGSILSVNPKLKDHPELIRQDPLGEGYLLTLKPKNLQREQKNFLWGEEALSWCRKEWERFKADVISELHSDQERLGMTMQDGGIKLNDMKKLIDPERYVQLVNAFLRKGENNISALKMGK